jgi:hypothetical protein
VSGVATITAVAVTIAVAVAVAAPILLRNSLVVPSSLDRLVRLPILHRLVLALSLCRVVALSARRW